MAKRVEEKELVSCLRNQRVCVRFVPNSRSKIQNPKHLLYGGMAENAIRTFVVPRLSSGKYVNVLTDSEKRFLEEAMGLEPNALSIYKRENNFWDDSNPDTIARVTLRKQDNFLDLSNPEEYIKYKILLANSDFVAGSLDELEKHPKATYQFVCINEGEEAAKAASNMNSTMECYMEFGKISDNKDKLALIVETLTARPVAPNTKIEFLKQKINELIQASPRKFLSVVKDTMLDTKLLIKNAVAAGIISRKGDYHYLRSDGSPLCETNEEPTVAVVARYLNSPKHQDIKLAIEAKLNTELND